MKKWQSSLRKVQELYQQADKIRQELELEKENKNSASKKNEIKQSRFSSNANRRVLVQAKSKVTEQHIPSHGSSDAKKQEPSPAKNIQRAEDISSDFNAFAMEQILMADGVAGSLRLRLEQRIEEGRPMTENDESETAYGLKAPEAELDQTAEGDPADDPYDIIKSTNHYDVQSAKMSTKSENEQQPLHSTRDRVRRSRESRGSSRLNTSTKKEQASASEKSSSMVAATNATSPYYQVVPEPEPLSLEK